MPDVIDNQSKLELPEGYPAESIEKVVLRDGTGLLIRAIRPDDAPRLQSAFARLSPHSVFLRFLETFRELPERQAHEFANLDYHERMALVAQIQEEGEIRLVGVARYAMVGPERPGLAESAIVVVDEYQGRGLGSLLLNRLIRYARAHEVTAFLATVHHTNAPIMRFIQRSGLPTHKRMIEPGVWEIQVSLQVNDQPPFPEYNRL